MQIVIDISDKAYGLLKYFEKSLGLNDKKDSNDDLKTALMRAVINGTPLPKGHGRLIILSEDAVKREQTSLGFSCQYWISEVSLSNATVAIIEADRAESEVTI